MAKGLFNYVTLVCVLLLGQYGGPSNAQSRLILEIGDPTIQSPVSPGRIACCLMNPGSSCCGGSQTSFEMLSPSLFESAEPANVVGSSFGFADQCSSPMPGLSLVDQVQLLTYANSPQGRACSLDAMAVSSSIATGNVSEELLENYFKNCLGVDIYAENNTHELSLTPLKAILSQVGYLKRQNKNSPHCMATRIGSKLLTSRHCIGNRIYNGKYILDEDLSNYRFSHLSEPSEEGYALGHLDGFEPEWNLSDLQGDWVVLNMIGFSETAASNDLISLGSVSIAIDEGKRIVIPSVFRSLLDLSPDNYDAWSEAIVPDVSPTCRVTYNNKKFLYHGCQTVGGVSGAPILVSDGNAGLRIVGLHSGGTNRSLVAQDSCIANIQALVPNWGVPTNDKMREALQ